MALRRHPVCGADSPHFLSFSRLSFTHSCSITETIMHASSVSLKRINIADMEKRSGMVGNG